MTLALGIRRVAIIAMTGLAAVVAAPTAFAQGGGRGGPGGGMFGMMRGGMTQMFEPSVSSRDLDGFATLFGLDGAQKDAVKMLFDGYQQQFASSAKKAREELDALREQAREARDPELFRKMGEQAQAFQKSRQQMEDGFLGDFKAVLTDTQAQKWPKFERMRRRTTTMSRGMISGERVDLIKLVDDLKLEADQRTALDPTLDQYELDLDRELVDRNKTYDEVQEHMRDFFQDPQSADEWIKKGREASVKVRDVNRRYESQVEAQLPADKQATFKEEFRKESFPQVYRPTYEGRVMEAASKLTDLDDNQKAAIASIMESYQRDLAAVQNDMEKAQEEQEMSFSMSSMMARRQQQGGQRGGRNNGGGQGGRAGGGPGGGFFADDSPLGQLRTKRHDLETGAVEKVKALLNEKQVAKLPERGNEDGAGPGRGGRDNTGNQDRAGGRRGAGNDNGGRRPNRNE